MDREISDQKELGSFVHDARTKLGLTQEALAQQAGVSRKWLIGLEQGIRTRAELSKVLDTFEALGISINLSFNNESETEPSDEDLYGPLSGISPTALDAIRKASSLNQPPLPKWPSLGFGQSGFKNFTGPEFGESGLQQTLEKGLPQSGLLASDVESRAPDDDEDDPDQESLDYHERHEHKDAADTDKQDLQ